MDLTTINLICGFLASVAAVAPASVGDYKWCAIGLAVSLANYLIWGLS